MPRADNAVQLHVVALTEETRRALSDLQRKQFPYALAKTLTEVAAMAVHAVQRRTREEYKLRTDFIPRGISRTAASKTDVRNRGIGTTVIFTKPLISGWMPTHETGDERTPGASGSGDKGKALAIPATDLTKRSFRTGSGRVKQQWSPKGLLHGYKIKRRKVSMTGGLENTRRGGRKGKAFIIRTKGSNVPMIVRRKGPKRYPLELLYLFSTRAKYKKTWRFETTVFEVVDKRFTQRLERNLAVAVARARG